MPDNVFSFPGTPQNEANVASGGSGPHDPSMEARVAVLEQIAKQTSETLAGIKTDLKTGIEAARDRHDRDFRITFGAIIAVALGLAGLMAKGFKWL